MCIGYKDIYECIDYREYRMSTEKYPCPCDRCAFNTNRKE